MAYFSDLSGSQPLPNMREVTAQTFFGALHDATVYPPHSHGEDQLYWFPDGAMNVLVGGQRWLVRATAAFWFPAGIVHSVEPLSEGTTHSVYSSARLRPAGERWDRPRAISCSPLMQAIIRHTTAGQLTAETRMACRELLSDSMQNSQEHNASLVMPRHPAARVVAEKILEDPRNDGSLADFARATGVSARTIMRAFLAETGSGFAQWRTQARLISSLSLLASGMPISGIADRVGYRTASGYIDAFRRHYGSTPAAYARARTS